jgi:hypothetical protein
MLPGQTGLFETVQPTWELMCLIVTLIHLAWLSLAGLARLQRPRQRCETRWYVHFVLEGWGHLDALLLAALFRTVVVVAVPACVWCVHG